MGFLVLVSVAGAIPELERNGRPHIRSERAIVRFADSGEVLLEKNADEVRPIASITKLVSLLLLSSDGLPKTEWITLEEEDKDRLKWSRSNLAIHRSFRPEDLFAAALVISENRAVYALVRASGAPREGFVERMNGYARELGMTKTSFRDPAGVDPENVSTARELLTLLDTAANDDRVQLIASRDRIEIVDGDARGL